MRNKTRKKGSFKKRCGSVVMTMVMFISSLALTQKPVDVKAADLVYQIMTVSSGFNADVFYDADENAGEVDSCESTGKVSYDKTCFYTENAEVDTEGGFPTNGIITDEDNNSLTWQLADYKQNNALRLEPGSDGTLTFSTVGCYQKLYFLVTAGGVGRGSNATMQVTVTYSDNSTSEQQFTVVDWYDSSNKVTAKYKRMYYNDSSSSSRSDGSVSSGPFLTKCEMAIDTTKLISNIKISNSLDNQNVFVCVYGVTGLTEDIAAPVLNDATDVTQDGFKASWSAVEDAGSYRFDLATDENFTQMVSGYNNRMVETTSLDITGLDNTGLSGRKLYYRVRSVTSGGGQSVSSSVKSVSLPEAYGINIDSANGDVAIYADDELLEKPQSYKDKTIKLVATPKEGYEFTGWMVVSGGITLSTESEATTTFTMPQGAVSIKANYELEGAEDKKKVEDTQKVAEKVLDTLTPDNKETEKDIIEAVKSVLKEAGLEDVEVIVENFKKTEATTENPGSVTGTIKITSGKESATVPFEKAIAKLDTPKDPDSGNVIGGVEGKEDSTFKISIIKGNEVVKTIDKVGNSDTFTFEGMEDGFYNLVIEETTVSDEKKLTTKIVEVVNGKVSNVGTVAVGDNQTAVEVEQDAPKVVAGGLEQLYISVPKVVTDAGVDVPQIIAEGGTAKVTLAVVKAKATDVLDSMKKEAESKKKAVGAVFDAEVDMKIIPASGEEQVIKISDTESLIHMVMPLSEKDQGKTGYQVLRSHLENGQTEETISVLPELTGTEKTSPAKEGFFIENGYVHIWAHKFSTYAVLYDEVVTVPVDDDDDDDSSDDGSQTAAIVSAKTGDVTPLGGLFTMLILSGAGLGAFAVKGRKKEDTEE